MSIEHLEEQAFEDDKMSFEAFKDWLWNYMPANVVTNKFLHNNSKFCESVAFECWRKYADSNVDKAYICSLAEGFFTTLFRYKPVLDDTEYED